MILTKFNIKTVSSFGSHHQKQLITEVLKQRPDLAKFKADKTLINTIKTQCKSYAYGGSILESIRSEDRVEKPNAIL